MIAARYTLALVAADYASLKALKKSRNIAMRWSENDRTKCIIGCFFTYLTIFFETFRSSAFATRCLTRTALFEDGSIFRDCLFQGLVAKRLEFLIVVTVLALATVTKLFVGKAFTIHLQALRLLAIAHSSFGRGRRGCRSSRVFFSGHLARLSLRIFLLGDKCGGRSANRRTRSTAGCLGATRRRSFGSRPIRRRWLGCRFASGWLKGGWKLWLFWSFAGGSILLIWIVMMETVFRRRI